MQRPFAPRALPRFPATMASSDYCPRLRYWQFSQVPVQNFRGTPSPLPRCARRTQIESVRRCWLHAYRIADHADSKLTRLYVGGSLALRLTALSGRTPAHRSPSARSAILIVCRFLYDIAPSAISSAELLLGVPASLQSKYSGLSEKDVTSTESSCGVGRAEKTKIPSATVVAAPIRSKLRVRRMSSAFH